MKDTFHYTFMKAYFSFHRTVMERAKAEGLTSGQPKILELLYEGDGVEQKVIAQHCEIESATAGSILNRMESAGLIERRRLDGNRRSLFVFLTEAGRQAAMKVKQIFIEAEKIALADISDEHREHLLINLRKIYNNTVNSEDVTW